MSGLPDPSGPASAASSKVPPAVEAELPDGGKRLIQVNFCKNPRCANFGVPAALPRHARRAAAVGAPGSAYTIAGAGKGLPLLHCRLCSEMPPMKSNLGIVEELLRLSLYLRTAPEAGCRNEACANFSRPASDSGAYQRFGLTDRGSPRFRCRICKKTFSLPVTPVLRQRLPHKNRMILTLLMNKSPLARICEVADVSMQTVYDKLDFFQRQLTTFAARHERALLDGFARDRLYVAVDRQEYIVNWSRRKDKRNVVLQALGSAELETGYVFGMHLNFDGSLDPTVVGAEAAAAGDFGVALPFRRHARLWLDPDYAAAQAESLKRLSRRSAMPAPGLAADIEETYDGSEVRSDIESAELVTSSRQFPNAGMQVRGEYTLYAHFFLLRELFKGVEKVRFYLDQEAGIRAACLAAFEDEIRQRRCDAFYVRIAKELTVDEKRRLVKESRERFDDVAGARPELSHGEVAVLLMQDEMARAATIGKWKDRWLAHPVPNGSEAQKALCYLTDFEDYDENHLANLYLKGSLHAVDRFFMQVRRRLSLLERPIGTASKAGRTWYGYGAYRPAHIEKILAVFRVYYNYVLKGKDGKTPAMRLGLATHVVKLDELLGVHETRKSPKEPRSKGL